MPSKKKPAVKPVDSRPIARCYAECDEADKTLFDMREAGAAWPDIRAKWEEVTGEATGVSTLPNRYARLKDNFAAIEDTDCATLLQCKRDVEALWEKEKWVRVAKAMEEKGTEAYEPEVLQRQWKKLMLQATELFESKDEDVKKRKVLHNDADADDEEEEADGSDEEDAVDGEV